MTKRTLQQIQESLAEQFYRYRRRGDDQGPEMGGGSFGLGSVTRSPPQFGGGANKTPKPPAQTTPPPAQTPPPSASKPRVQMKPGETQDQAMLRTSREEIAKSRNDQAGAKVWRPGESKPKVWRQGDSEKGPAQSDKSLPPGQYVDKSGIKRNADGTPVPTVLQVKPGAEQSGPKFDPNKKYDTGLERKPGPGTREIWNTKPRKEQTPLKPEEVAARDQRSQQRYTPNLKDKRERRAGYASVGGHAAALAALLWAQKQKEKESGGSEPTGSSAASTDSQAANQPVSVELLSPSVNNSGSSDVDLPTVTMQPKSNSGSVSEPESGSMSGRIISEPRKQVPDTELKSLPAVTVTAEPSGGAAKSDPNVKQPVNNADAEKAKAEKDRKEAEARAEAEKSRREAEARAEKDRKEAEARNKPAERPQSRPDSGNQEKSGAGSSDREGPGTKTSPGGTGEKPGDRSGPGSGTGNDPDYKEPRYRNRGTMTQLPEQQLSATQSRLLEKYNNFLQEDSAVYENKQDPRQVIEQYLGKRLSNSEYSAFLRTVGAESGSQPLERAHVASVILNRAKAARGDIIGVLNTPAQFQAITGPKGYQGTVFKPYYSNAKSIIPGIDQEIAGTLELVKPGLTHFSAADPAAYKEVGGMKKYREVMKMYSKDPNKSRVYASVFGNLGPVPYNPGANPMVKRERKLGDKFRDPYAGLVGPTNTAQVEPSGGAAKPEPRAKKPTDTDKQKPETKPGYYTVGDSHGEGIAVYGKGKDGPNWINKSKVGASVVDKDQFKTHMANIEGIPAGSVVTISGGANDIGRSNHQAIVDNLNKLIAASKAKGHQVVYVLPTESPDPAKKQQREALRQTLLKGVTGANILDLGMASKTDKQQVHLDDKGYNRIAKNISDMFVPGKLSPSGKPVGTQVLPDWSKYKYGDLGPLVKNDQGEWTTVDGQRSATDPKFIADIEKLDNYTPPETFLDKVQRSLPPSLGGKGELVSKVFGDKKKSAAPAAPEPVVPPAATDKQPPKDSGSGDWFEKLYGIDKAKEYVQAQKAETNKKEQERTRKSLGLAPGEEIVDIPLKKEPPKEVSPEKIKVIGEPSGETRPIPPGTVLGPARQSVSVPPPEAKAQPAKAEKSVVSKDVTALLQKDQAGLKQARRELSDFEREFAAKRAKGEKEFTWYNKKGEPYQVATNLKGEKSPAKVSNVAAANPADTSLKQIMSKSLSPDQSLDAGEKLIDVPDITNTSNKFDLPAEPPQEPKPSEIQQALKDFEREKAALDADEETINIDGLISSANKDAKASSTGAFNESINTKSDVELHNLLKLAGRIK